MSAAPRVDLLSFGCRLNIVESEAMRREALRSGQLDLTIVNTCAVTAEAVRQSRQAVRRARAAHPTGRLVITGCAAEIDPVGFGAMPGVDAILPNRVKADPASWPMDEGASPEADGASGGPSLGGRSHSRGFVEVQNGCDHRCTFCVIPLGRGASRSVTPDTVVSRIRALVEEGAREVVLTGVDVTSYGGDLASGLRLGNLLAHVLRAVPELPRLRLSSLDCIEADPALLDLVATEPRLMPHLHVSLQSGSDLILKRMKRRHGRSDAIAFCRTLRALRPEIVFGADLIAGFPTEDEAMFADTLDLIEACGITYVHAFSYSQRPGTPAARMPPVPGDVARDRGRRLREAGERRLGQHLEGMVGRTVEVLTERGGTGRAPDFTLVRLPPETPPGLLQPATLCGHDGRVAIADTAASGLRRPA
ncbi:tRNA (N(6)-L-threonylcarbamoyladenosine(37)-C(2))-methylthiotransferase MtaB [Lichenihabitans sp. Uapishka_5]|uniref:tRNA (N(6)-L-threonylcarbamoyladenosine(37)-C(2))- methylthiotransferase MtaB n=1 Tax=Lichenihabitans sp. Uapishka_5 TaxID=3037302 RepID=UPI0029E7DEBE|nr:tRNA (N(6)-L-threonylcarbamoyladenosine(37)-C(2))-methylthiotransferase MtaB [Lichenihabitans sp. Uapishka_5]MDX7950004.1 tRNA (N(6)-L-threonylcarbamoyladenosine(37)-C(2))-methylthiotransferase MtaB [Lichenihabitans sp. Uapishka_5]